MGLINTKWLKENKVMIKCRDYEFKQQLQTREFCFKENIYWNKQEKSSTEEDR